MRITSKGQVTIPIEVREKTGLLPHTEVTFEIINGKTCIEKVKDSNRKVNAIERLKGKATVKMTTDEIMRLTRG